MFAIFVVLCAVAFPTAFSVEVSDEDWALKIPAAGNSAYYFRKDSQAPNLAADYCKQRGMFLLEIPNVDANNIIQQAIISNNLAGSNFWTSGSRQADGVTWEWPRTGSPFVYKNWAQAPSPSGSNKDCLTVTVNNGNLLWYDIDCKQQQFFICQTPA